MNNRIYLFGGISFLLVTGAVGYYAYASRSTENSLTAVSTTPQVEVMDEVVSPVTSVPTLVDVNTLISVTTPTQESIVQSPLNVSGIARGSWYFEGSFPITLQDADGKMIATGIATSTGEWMTEDFVPFTATLTWASTTTKTGSLILKRDNPSGLPENDRSISIPVNF